MGIIKESLLNIRSRWITFMVGVLLIAVSFSVYIAVDSAVGSVNEYTTGGILNTPLYRIAITLNDELYSEAGGDLNSLINDKRVQGTFEYSYPYTLLFENSNELISQPTESVTFSCYADLYDEYIIAGRKVENKGEVLLPKYFGEYGSIENSTKLEEELIGKTIKVKKEILSEVTDTIAQIVYYDFEVVGIYDNSAASIDYWFLINDKELAEISETKSIKPVTDEEYEIVAAKNNMTVEEYKRNEASIVASNLSCTGIYTYNYKQAEDIIAEYGILPVAKHTPMEYKQMEMLSYAGTFISFIIMLVGLINILISILHSIGRREWEYALKLAVGYKKKRLYITLATELVITTIAGIIIGVAGCYGIIGFIKDRFITNLMIDFISMDLPLLPGSFFKGISVIGIAIVLSFAIGCYRISEINVSEALRMEE